MSPRLCIDCRWAVEDMPGYWDCSNPATRLPPRVSPVTGKPEVRPQMSCDTERRLGTACGPDGKLWEPKADTPAGFV
jgi:hypothetical protein